MIIWQKMRSDKFYGQLHSVEVNYNLCFAQMLIISFSTSDLGVFLIVISDGIIFAEKGKRQ